MTIENEKSVDRRVFVSYKMHNAADPEKLLSSFFKSNNIYYYIAGEDLMAGVSLHDKIVEKMSPCTDLLVVMNDNAIKKPSWIIKEVGMAEMNRMNIIPWIVSEKSDRDYIKKALNKFLIKEDTKAIIGSETNDVIKSLEATFEVKVSQESITGVTSENSMPKEYLKQLELSYKIVPSDFNYKIVPNPNPSNKITDADVIILKEVLIFILWVIKHKDMNKKLKEVRSENTNIGISDEIGKLPVGGQGVLKYGPEKYTVSRNGNDSYSVTAKSSNSSDEVLMYKGTFKEVIKYLKDNNMI